MCQCGRAQCSLSFQRLLHGHAEKDTLMIFALFGTLKAAAVLFLACYS
jgi:hypothetical protein